MSRWSIAFGETGAWRVTGGRGRMLLSRIVSGEEKRGNLLDHSRIVSFRRAVKRVVDVVGAVGALTVAIPVIAGVSIAIRKGMGSPILFIQDRPGLHGEPFRMHKFRTMTIETDAGGAPLPDSFRLAPLGSSLRRWSVDELPELWDVLRGDMSLVGPRPLLMEYLDLYSDEQMRRHEMRPGLTGLAQISGRNDQTWDERLSLDVWYVDHWSLWLDAKVLALTVVKVFTREGISAPGEATMARFKGSECE